MPLSRSDYDKTCPKCALAGDAVKATTGSRDVVTVDLRCPHCGHTWAVTLTSKTA
jgi:uncharacterized Zn finger protein